MSSPKFCSVTCIFGISNESLKQLAIAEEKSIPANRDVPLGLASHLSVILKGEVSTSTLGNESWDGRCWWTAICHGRALVSGSNDLAHGPPPDSDSSRPQNWESW